MTAATATALLVGGLWFAHALRIGRRATDNGARNAGLAALLASFAALKFALIGARASDDALAVGLLAGTVGLLSYRWWQFVLGFLRPTGRTGLVSRLARAGATRAWRWLARPLFAASAFIVAQVTLAAIAMLRPISRRVGSLARSTLGYLWPALDGRRLRRLALAYAADLQAAGPTDRARAEQALAALLQARDLPPVPVLCVQSPRQVALMLAALRAFGESIEPEHNDAWADAARRSPSRVEQGEWHDLIERLRSARLGRPPSLAWLIEPDQWWFAPELSGARMAATTRELADHLERASSERQLVAAAVRIEGLRVPLGEAGGTAFGRVAEALVCHGRPSSTAPALRALGELLRSAYWVALTPAAAILCEWPIAQRRDEHGRLVSAGGPALRFADGFEVYVMGQAAVPAQLVMAPSELTIEQVQQIDNDDVRRELLLTVFGRDGYIATLAARPELIAREPLRRGRLHGRCRLGRRGRSR
jgi:hypothetical protein